MHTLQWSRNDNYIGSADSIVRNFCWTVLLNKMWTSCCIQSRSIVCALPTYSWGHSVNNFIHQWNLKCLCTLTMTHYVVHTNREHNWTTYIILSILNCFTKMNFTKCALLYESHSIIGLQLHPLFLFHSLNYSWAVFVIYTCIVATHYHDSLCIFTIVIVDCLTIWIVNFYEIAMCASLPSRIS